LHKIDLPNKNPSLLTASYFDGAVGSSDSIGKFAGVKASKSMPTSVRYMGDQVTHIQRLKQLVSTSSVAHPYENNKLFLANGGNIISQTSTVSSLQHSVSHPFYSTIQSWLSLNSSNNEIYETRETPNTSSTPSSAPNKNFLSFSTSHIPTVLLLRHHLAFPHHHKIPNPSQYGSPSPYPKKKGGGLFSVDVNNSGVTVPLPGSLPLILELLVALSHASLEYNPSLYVNTILPFLLPLFYLPYLCSSINPKVLQPPDSSSSVLPSHTVSPTTHHCPPCFSLTASLASGTHSADAVQLPLPLSSNPIHLYFARFVSSMFRSHTTLLYGDKYNIEYINDNTYSLLNNVWIPLSKSMFPNSTSSDCMLPRVSLPPPTLRLHEHGSFFSIHTPFSMENEAKGETRMGDNLENKLDAGVEIEGFSSSVDAGPSLTCLPSILQHPLPLQHYARYFLLPEDELEEINYVNTNRGMPMGIRSPNSTVNNQKKNNKHQETEKHKISKKNNANMYSIGDSKQHITPFLFPLPHYTYTLLLQQQKREIKKHRKIITKIKKETEMSLDKQFFSEASKSQKVPSLLSSVSNAVYHPDSNSLDLSPVHELGSPDIKENLENLERKDGQPHAFFLPVLEGGVDENNKNEISSSLSSPLAPLSLNSSANENNMMMGQYASSPVPLLSSSIRRMKLSPSYGITSLRNVSPHPASPEIKKEDHCCSPRSYSSSYSSAPSSKMFRPSAEASLSKSNSQNKHLLKLQLPSLYPALSTYSPAFSTLPSSISHTLYTISSSNAFFFYHYYDRV
jgi:hypothetical protein